MAQVAWFERRDKGIKDKLLDYFLFSSENLYAFQIFQYEKKYFSNTPGKSRIIPG